MPFYQRSAVKLHYVCRGPIPRDSRNPVLVFEHGIGGDIRQSSRFLAPERTGIPEEKLSIIHADFRGHGQSELGPVEDLSIETLAGDLRALLDHLAIQQAIVGGISMGAAAALRMAVAWPERCQALILSRPAWADGWMSAPARQALALVAELLSAQDWRRTAVERLERSEILRSIDEVCPDAGKSVRGQVLSLLSHPENRASRITCLRRLSCARGLDDLDRDLEGVCCPTLILAAEGDPIHPFACALRIAYRLTNCLFVRITPKSARDEASHLREVDQHIGEFLPSLVRPPAESERESEVLHNRSMEHEFS